MSSNKIIINFCPTGMVPKKSHNQSVPVSPQEIIEQTHQAHEMGITLVHLHARLDDEQPTYSKSVYQTIFEGVRKHCPGLIICGSTSGRNFPEFEKRSEVIELYPDMCSLTLSSLNFAEQASLNDPAMIRALMEKMLEYGVRPEFECFDLGMINYGNYLIRKYELSQQIYWNLIFGNIFGAQPGFSQMGAMLEAVPKGHHVAFGGIGGYQLAVNAMAIACGLGVRVGLEDNIWFDRQKTEPATNMTLLKRVHDLIELHQGSVMSSQELGLYNSNYVR